MNKEIKEIKHRLQLLHAECNPKAREEDINWVIDYITNLQQENERLKQVMLVKQYYSETLPEGTEFVVLTKENYDRQQKDIQLELIDYKSRCEKAIDKLTIKQARFINEKGYVLDDNDLDEIMYILQNGSDSQ